MKPFLLTCKKTFHSFQTMDSPQLYLSLDETPSLTSSSTDTSTQQPPPRQPGKKKRVESTVERSEVIRTLWKREPPIPIKDIASIVGMSYHPVLGAIKKIVECEELGLPLSEIVKPKGRKPKRSAQVEEMVKQHLTAERTASLASAVAPLNADGVDVKKTTVWRMTKDAKVSFKRTKKATRGPHRADY